LHRVSIGAFLRLAEAVLAFDLEVVEALFEGKADNLGALRLGGSVGHQRQAHAQLLEAIEGLMSAGKHAQLGFVDLVEAIGDRVANLARGDRPASGAREPGESLRNDVAPGRADTRAPVLVASRVGPQAPRIS